MWGSANLWISGSGDFGIWGFVDLGIWGSGDLGIVGFGDTVFLGSADLGLGYFVNLVYSSVCSSASQEKPILFAPKGSVWGVGYLGG